MRLGEGEREKRLRQLAEMYSRARRIERLREINIAEGCGQRNWRRIGRGEIEAGEARGEREKGGKELRRQIDAVSETEGLKAKERPSLHEPFHGRLRMIDSSFARSIVHYLWRKVHYL